MRAVEHGYSLAAYTMRPTTVRRKRVLVNCAGFGEVKRTEKQEGYSLTVNLPNQTIADKHGLMFKFEIAPSRKEVLPKGLDDIGTTLQHAAAIDAIRKIPHRHHVRLRRRKVLLQRPLTQFSILASQRSQ